MKNTKTMYLFARTPVHVGAGNSVGAVDSPIMRERHTRIPIIPGSSLKGVLADLWAGDVDEKGKRNKDSELVALFGSDDDKTASAGTLLIGEARALAFPLRSAKGGFAWITCPHVLRKWKEDTKANFEVPNVENEDCLASNGVCLKNGNVVVLEEYKFTARGNVSADICNAFAGVMPDVSIWKDEIKEKLAIVSDELFSYFVENACEIVSRIRIDDKTGVVAKGALFNQEQCPSETMFYTVICDAGRKASPDAIGKLKEKLDGVGNVIQIGGDATVGLGFCSVSFK